MAPEAPLIEAVNLTRTYGRQRTANAVTAIDEVNIRVERATLHAIVGPSGSGKSTLLHLLGALDRPTSGLVVFHGEDLGGKTERVLARMRSRQFGFIFQRFNLVPSLTAADNIALPGRLAGVGVDPAWLDTLTDRLSLDRQTLRRKPDQLSGGEQQRVAIARALAARPELVFADEPTGSLDSETAAQTVEILRGVTVDLGTSVVIVTHDLLIADQADHLTHLLDGRVIPMPSASADVVVRPEAAPVDGTLAGA